MPQISVLVKIFFNQAQTRGIESSQIQAAVEQFERQIVLIRDLIDNFGPEEDQQSAAKRKKITHLKNHRSVIAKEVCDTILTQVKDRMILRIICVQQNYSMPKILELSGRHFLRTYLTQL